MSPLCIAVFRKGYWQYQAHPESYDACCILLLQVAPLYVLESSIGLKNASSYLQPTIPLLLAGMQNNLKAWIDEFMVCNRTEKLFFQSLEIFLY